MELNIKPVSSPGAKALKTYLSWTVLSILALIITLSCGSGAKEPATPSLRELETSMVTEGVKILLNGTAVQRDSVVRSFYGIKNTDLLVDHLNDPDENVSIGMVSALGYIKDPKTADALNSKLMTTEDYLMRETIIFALGEIGDTSSVNLLTQIMLDDTADRNLQLSLPLDLVKFAKGDMTESVAKTFDTVLTNRKDDTELCSFVASAMVEILNEGNHEMFSKHLPMLKKMAAERKAVAGEDLIWTSLALAIERLEEFDSPTS